MRTGKDGSKTLRAEKDNDAQEEKEEEHASMRAMYRDLISFLSSDRADLRRMAAEATLAATTAPPSSSSSSSSSPAIAAVEALVEHGAIVPLCRLASHPDRTGLHALESLLRISSMAESSPIVRGGVDADMIEGGGLIRRLTEIALSPPPPSSPLLPAAAVAAAVAAAAAAARGRKGEGGGDDNGGEETWRERTDASLALLANLTRSERGAVEFCGKTMPDEAVYSGTAAVAAADAGDGGGGGGDATRKEAKPAVSLLLARFLLPSLVRDRERGTPSTSGGGQDGSRHRPSGHGQGGAADNQNDSDGDKDGGGGVFGWSGHDPFQHFASILMNAAQVEQGRRFVLRISTSPQSKSTSVLQSLLPYLRHPNPVRRRGIAGLLKNIAYFDPDSSWWLLNVVDITRHLLYPLSGPEELDADDKIGLDPTLWLEGPAKKREPDRLVRLLLVECVLLLCASGRKSREALRAKRTYVILKTMDASEQDEEISARIDDVVQYLRRDEEGTEEGSSDRRAEETYRRGKVGAKAGRGEDVIVSDVGARPQAEVVDTDANERTAQPLYSSMSQLKSALPHSTKDHDEQTMPTTKDDEADDDDDFDGVD